jgi:FMN phosphatase YigB (HAD superfamily)
MTEEQQKDIAQLFEAMGKSGGRFVIGQVIGSQTNYIGDNHAEKDEKTPHDEDIPHSEEERNEERFHFVHPEIEDEEAWRIHQAIKRLVAYQKIPEICAYLKELKQKGKVLLPSVSAVMYNELVRLGMPTGNGYSEKHFTNSYMK